MAAEVGTKASAPKYETYIDTQLGRVRTRMRALDAGRSLLTLGIVSGAYFLLLAAFDLAVKGADDALFNGIRLGAFAIYVVAIVLLLGQLSSRLYCRINPYYAARKLEENIADPKNSVINWLDLKSAELPGAIRSAVGQRAALTLKQADPDQAVSPKSNWVLGGVLAALALGIVVLFALGPNQFNSLLQRAFAPFLKIGIGTRTEITLLRPLGGDVTVPLNQRVDFQAGIEGRFPKLGQPGAPRLLYRYQTADPYVPLTLDEAHDGTWTATLLGDQVQNGFWYKIAAGDKETPEYQVKVQSLPQANRFEVTYHYRPYRKLADDTVAFPNELAVIPRLKDYRGTEVELVVHTNRELRQARVEVDSDGAKTDLPGEILPGDHRTMRVRLTLERRGTFRVLFTSNDGEENTDRSPYQIDVLDDLAPHVVLTEPAKDVSMPLGGTLTLKGKARDDIGIKALALRLKVLQGDVQPALTPKIYREGKSFQFDDGTYPDTLDYQDLLYFDKIKTVQGEPFPLKAGMVLEYALEARDNSDYPDKDGNVGLSQTYKITILDTPKDDKKQKEERQKAEEQQQKQEQQQDQQQAKDNQKHQDKQAKDDSPMGEKEKQDIEKKMDQVRKELDQSKDDKQDKQKSEPKGNDQKPGENKAGNAGDNKNADKKGNQNQDQAGEKKDSGKNGAQAGEKKDAGKKSQADQAANSKEPAAKDQAEERPGETKGPGTDEKESTKTKGSDNSVGKTDDGKSKEKPGGAQAKDNGDKGGESGAAKEKSGPSSQGEPQGKAKGSDNGKKDKTDPKDATSQDVADMKEKLKQKEQVKKTVDELAKVAKEAKDPAVRKAAQEALDKQSQETKTEAGQGKDDNQAKADDNQGKGQGSQSKAAKKGNDPKDDTKPGNKVTGSGPDGKIPKDDIAKQDPDAKLANRGGELQLEDLRKRMTPETLKKLGWTDQEWQQFLKDAQAYQNDQQRVPSARAIPDKKGNATTFPGSRLRPIDSNPDAVLDSLQTDRSLPPPEFREAQRQFTTPNTPQKK